MARPDDPDVRLLRALRAGTGVQGISGDDLAGLRGAGYRIDGDERAGFCLKKSPAALVADDILASLPESLEDGDIGREIIVFEETGSTNDLAAVAGDGGAAGGLVVFAEKQRAGRGRLGRVWESRPRLGLWFSVLLRPVRAPVERWPELTFCAALAVARTAEEQTSLPTKIKWPNDVLVEDRKVAGILLECHHRQTPGFVVVGIGVNILQTADDFDPALLNRAGSLEMLARKHRGAVAIERRIVAGSLLRHLQRIYTQWPENFATIMLECEKRGCIPPADALLE